MYDFVVSIVPADGLADICKHSDEPVRVSYVRYTGTWSITYILNVNIIEFLEQHNEENVVAI